MRLTFFKDPGSIRLEGFESFINRFGLNDHSGSAAKRAVIYFPVALVIRIVPEIVNPNLQNLALTRAPQKAFRQRPIEHGREKCDDIQALQMFVLGRRLGSL